MFHRWKKQATLSTQAYAGARSMEKVKSFEDASADGLMYDKGDRRPMSALGPKCNCEGMPRRDFLKLGLGAFAGLSFVDLLQQRVLAKQLALAAGQSSPANVNCILIWLDGGPSHYESFDPKPDAPAD